jgi:hypothetical protein
MTHANQHGVATVFMSFGYFFVVKQMTIKKQEQILQIQNLINSLIKYKAY